MYIKITFLLLSLVFKDSLQSCSSTVAITTCTWDSLNTARPLRVSDYKTYLSFSKGNLEGVPNEAFRHFPQITVLQLSSNKIKTIEANALEGLVNLKQLNLYDNQLSAIEETTLGPCTSLEKLDLGLNKISFIHDNALRYLTNLAYLNLAFNSLKVVPGAVNFLPHLKILKLDNNAIETLKSGAFSSLNQLEELSLNDNKLTRIEREAFKGLAKLKKLDLRANFLSDINVGQMLEGAKNLKLISLSINNFKCDNLRKILEGFGRSSVEVARGVSKQANNVNINGISCKA